MTYLHKCGTRECVQYGQSSYGCGCHKTNEQFLQELTTWRDIASPPDVSVRVQVFAPPYGAMSGHFDGKKWHCHSCLNEDAQPTHWALLLPPPNCL